LSPPSFLAKPTPPFPVGSFADTANRQKGYYKSEMRTLLHIQINRQFIQFLLEALFLFGLLVADARGTVFYVDSTGGNNANSGTTPNSAWQTLTKLNGTHFSAGDKILFKTGRSWIGTLSPLGSGATNRAIVISSYGTNPALPIINGNGNADAVILTNQEYWEINNLEVINPGSIDAERRGIRLCAANYGIVNHLYVSNCHVHNIRGKVDARNGDALAKRTGGIIVEVIDDSMMATRFNDIIIQNCIISSVTNQGIVACGNISGGGHNYPGTTAWNNRHCSNLIIRNNVINGVCKNAMSIRYGDNTCLVEHNVVFNTALATSGNQIAAYGCWGTVFQFNEGYGNNGGDKGIDGSLYDSDLQCVQTVWQYSYSHDEFFGLFVQYAAAPTDGSMDTNAVVRYNISRNDRGSIFAFAGDGTAKSSAFIYNNTVYTSENLAPTYVDNRSKGHANVFYNNIFYNLSSTASYHLTSANSNNFDYNVFYNPNGAPIGQPNDIHGLVSGDPMFVASGMGINGLNGVAGCKLQSGSPCIDSGTTITTTLTGNPNAGGLDYWGNRVPYKGVTDRGANEWSGSASGSTGKGAP
jgi:hypothetical protein